MYMYITTQSMIMDGICVCVYTCIYMHLTFSYEAYTVDSLLQKCPWPWTSLLLRWRRERWWWLVWWRRALESWRDPSCCLWSPQKAQRKVNVHVWLPSLYSNCMFIFLCMYMYRNISVLKQLFISVCISSCELVPRDTSVLILTEWHIHVHTYMHRTKATWDMMPRIRILDIYMYNN